MLQPFNKKRVEDAKINLLFCPCLELNFQGHPGDEMISQAEVKDSQHLCEALWL